MCESMADIQSPTAEIRRGIKKIEEEEERNDRAKIYWPALLHRAAINSWEINWAATIKYGIYGI